MCVHKFSLDTVKYNFKQQKKIAFCKKAFKQKQMHYTKSFMNIDKTAR